jgi:large subunit ribosomal protein L4
MAKVEVKNLEGKKIEEIELNDDVFGLEMNDSLVHQAYVAQYANKRNPIAHTKDRSERAGTGKKPWKQKGTGRARAGSVRSPLWRKGGITFGPTNERNFSKKINRKMKALATKMVLSAKLKDGEVVVVDKFDFKDNKTKEASKALEVLKIDKKVLWAFSAETKSGMQASRNIKNVKNISVDSLNILDMLNNKFLLLDKDSVKNIESRYLKTEEKKEVSSKIAEDNKK